MVDDTGDDEATDETPRQPEPGVSIPGHEPSRYPGSTVIGWPIGDLPTPVALIDLDLFEQNAHSISSVLSARACTWRPHTKAHKSPFLARIQLAAGAQGITCAKVGEAEVMAAAGIDDILVANEFGDPRKWRRMAALQKHAHVTACVDAPEHVRWASQAASDQGTMLPLLVEIDVGMGRTGVTTVDQVLDLARLIRDSNGVHLDGVMGYEGHLLTDQSDTRKAERCREDLTVLRVAADELRGAGHDISTVSAGGTGSFQAASDIDWLTECQAGGGCLMDRFYAEQCHVDLAFALTLMTSVVSSRADRAVVDAGYKALGWLTGLPLPRILDRDQAVFSGLSAEHGSIQTPGSHIGVGERIQVIPGYSDAMLFLHDFALGHRQGVVTDIIRLEGRGRLT